MDFHVPNLPDENLIRVHKGLPISYLIISFRMAVQLLDSWQRLNLFLFRNSQETINRNLVQAVK